MSSDVFDDISKGLTILADDIQRMLSDRKGQNDRKSGDSQKESQLKSFQQLTTFYSNKDEAKKAQEEDPMIVFVNKITKEIFKD